MHWSVQLQVDGHIQKLYNRRVWNFTFNNCSSWLPKRLSKKSDCVTLSERSGQQLQRLNYPNSPHKTLLHSNVKMLCLNLSLNNRGLILVKYLSTLDPSVRIIRSQSDHWWKVFYCCFSIFFELQWNNNNYSGNDDDDHKCDKLKKIL